MSFFQVDSQHLNQVSARTTGLANQIRQDSALMMAQVQELQGSWSGSASVAFADCVGRWRAAQMQMEAALDSIAGALTQASQQYEQAETGVAGMFSAGS